MTADQSASSLSSSFAATSTASDGSVYLVGSSGHPNFGEELATAAWLRHLAVARPDADVWLDCPSPSNASHLFAGLHPRLRVTDSLFRLAWETTDMGHEAARDHVDRRVRDLGTPRYDLGLLRAREADTVHLLGGGYVNAIWPHHGLLPRLALALREIAGARVVGTGLGLVPVDEDADVVSALSSFDHLSLRDTPSAELVGRETGLADAFLGLDRLPAFRAGGYTADAADADVWVCLQSDLTTPEVFDAAVEKVRALLLSPDLRNARVRYVECLPGVDRIAFDRLSDLIAEEDFLPFVDVWRRGIPFGQDQRWITSRFHLHLVAAACGARGTVLPMSDYYRVKHESLVELGTGWSVSSPDQQDLGEPTRSLPYRSTAARLHQRKQAEADAIYPR